MTQAPATYQTQASRSVAPSALDGGDWLRPTGSSIAVQSGTPLYAQQKIARYVHAGLQEPARSDTTTWPQPLKKIIWIIWSPQAGASYTSKSILPNSHICMHIHMRTILSIRVHIRQHQAVRVTGARTLLLCQYISEFPLHYNGVRVTSQSLPAPRLIAADSGGAAATSAATVLTPHST